MTEPVKPFWCAHRPRCVSQVEHDRNLDEYIRTIEMRPPPEPWSVKANRWADRIAWGIVIFAVLYFGAHVIAFITGGHP